MTKPVIFLDRDGTLNPDPGYIASLDQYTFYEDALDALDLLASQGFRFAIATNQSGVARGLIERRHLDEIHRFIAHSLEKRGIPFLGVYACNHGPDEGCDCRKPRTGLFEQVARDHSVRLESAYVIGDSVRDMQAGKALGMKTVLVRTGEGASAEKELSDMGIEVDFVGDTLMDCARYVISQEVPV
ncbi:MAG: D-glycero-alpha-D-manno-heptose-1,7-bisphosphate 7-phosphatase [Fidelibacterota bacterium]